jgi:hypothetical protein
MSADGQLSQKISHLHQAEKWIHFTQDQDKAGNAGDAQ